MATPGSVGAAGAVAAQAVLEWVDGGIEDSNAIGGADAHDAVLRRANRRRSAERGCLHALVRIVTVHAGGVAIVIENAALSAIVNVVPKRKRMAAFGEFGEDVGRRGRDAAAAVVTS